MGFSSDRMQYEDEGCEVDFVWRRTSDPFAPPPTPGQGQWGRHHYDQIGRMTGRVPRTAQ